MSVPYTEYLKFRKNWILYTRILTKKYHIPELKWLGIPYTQNPWPGLKNTGPIGFTVVSLSYCSLTSEVVSRTCWCVSSVTAFAWSVAERTRYIRAYRDFLDHCWVKEAYTCAALVSLLGGTTEMLAKRLVGPGGGDSHMKQTGMLAVSLRGVNVGFWSCWGCSGQSANILSRHGLV